MNKNLISTYSSALYSIYLDDNKDEIFEDLKLIKWIFINKPELIRTLNSLLISKNERNKIIDHIFKNKINLMVINFMHVMVVNGGFFEIVNIIKNILQKIDEEKGICFTTIETPFELESKQLQKITKALAHRTKKEISVDIIINKSLIGGIKITFGTEVIDGSIKHKLDLIRRSLLKK